MENRKKDHLLQPKWRLVYEREKCLKDKENAFVFLAEKSFSIHLQ